MNTPEGKSRDWMINSDVAINVDEEQRVQQRYILCVLHFATNGGFWNKKSNWLNAERSECDWYGITCNNENNIIERVDLSENNVTGTLPNEIASLSNLVALNMSHDNISGNIPEKIFNLLDELETLDMQGNQILGTIPERAASMSKSRLRFLDLGSNQLTGSFPFFPNAESLSFDKNNLASIDDRYSTSSPSLKSFKGFHNIFSGPLPTIWNLPNLIELDLGYNFWSGTIPQDLWNLPSLKTLWLDHCNLTGPLPSYSESDSMHRLWLNTNLLSGTIPSRFGWNWTKLYSVKLDANLLAGSITPEQCNIWNAPNSTRGRPWTFDTDCQIDCACCTNANCA
jgi:Leucine-rich repeat (LRR) protein